MPHLKIVFKEAESSNYEQLLDQEVVTFGRTSVNDIVLSFPDISRTHAEIRKTAEGYILKDLGSFNGTMVNGVAIQGWFLQHQDQIQIGSKVTLTFLYAEGEDRPLEADSGTNEEGQHIMASIDPSLQQETVSMLKPPRSQQSDEEHASYATNNKILYVLYQISQTLNRTSDFDELLLTIMDLIFEIIDADYGFIAILGTDSEEIVIKVIKHRDSPTDPTESVQVSTTVLKKVLEEKTSILMSNLKNDMENTPSISIQNIQSVLSVPLWQKEEVIGMIQLNSFSPARFFTKQDLNLLHTISNQVAMAIEQADLTERVQLTESLERALEEVRENKKELEIRHQQLKETQAKLVQSEKMAGLGILVDGVAHEINNPLNFIFAGTNSLEMGLKRFQEFLLEVAEDDPEITQVLETRFTYLFEQLSPIQLGSHRIDAIVKDLKTFSRTDQEEQHAVYIVENLQATLKLIKSKFQETVEFVEVFQADPIIECWPSQLNQVFMNIIINACHAIEKKRSSSKTLPLNTLTIHTSVKERLLEIIFQDTGCGMTEEVQKKIFDPFFTTKGVGKGTGPGMSISYGIIEKHQGQIEVESQIDQGTTIKVLLPITGISGR